MNDPWLSVLIPTYNGKDYLKFTMESILSQGDDEIECIAIDDGSTDVTIEILNSYLDKLPIKIIQGERKGNWVASTNYALSIATAKYVCFLHQDDIWLGERLCTMKRLIAKYPEVSFFLHPSLFIDQVGNVLGEWNVPLPAYPRLIPPSMMTERLLIQNFISVPAPIFKREVAINLQGLDESLWYTADWDFWLKISAIGSTLYYPKPLSAFRVHSNSQTVIRSSTLIEFQEQMEIVVERYWSQWQANSSIRNKIKRIAIFSIQVNTILAGIFHGYKLNFLKLLGAFLGLGFRGCYQYLQCSRIWERVFARLKIKSTS